MREEKDILEMINRDIEESDFMIYTINSNEYHLIYKEHRAIYKADDILCNGPLERCYGFVLGIQYMRKLM